MYYKLSDYNTVNGIVGHECVNEIVIDRLLDILGIEHLGYQLIHADVLVDGKRYETWLNASEDFKAPGESKIALDTFYELERREGESPLEFCARWGWGEQVWRSIVVDYLVFNRDRHGVNLEVLRNPRARTMRLAEAADELGCTRQNLHVLAKRGSLPVAKRSGKATLFLRADVHARASGDAAGA